MEKESAPAALRYSISSGGGFFAKYVVGVVMSDGKSEPGTCRICESTIQTRKMGTTINGYCPKCKE